MEKQKRKVKVPKKKQEAVEKLVRLIEKSKTVVVASIENLSSAQFQLMKRILKKEAEMVVVKKSSITRAVEKSSKKNIKELENHISSNFVILFSDKDAFELAATLAENSTPARAKPGQIAPDDIILEAGPTDLPAGPAISDFTKANVPTKIEAGKIAVKENTVLVKKGEKISDDAATILNKLDIMPLSIGLEPIAAYDAGEGKVFVGIRVNKHKMIHELAELARNATALALHINYAANETISLLLAKANLQATTLNSNLNQIKTE